MKNIISFFIILTLSFFSYAEGSYDKAKKLSQYIVEEFGVSPKALSFLLTYDENSYLPLATYKKVGYYKYFEELEDNGYIQIHIVTTLPNGKKMEEQIQPKPTLKGWSVKKGIEP
jgi:hypothetical protein